MISATLTRPLMLWALGGALAAGTAGGIWLGGRLAQGELAEARAELVTCQRGRADANAAAVTGKDEVANAVRPVADNAATVRAAIRDELTMITEERRDVPVPDCLLATDDDAERMRRISTAGNPDLRGGRDGRD